MQARKTVWLGLAAVACILLPVAAQAHSTGIPTLQYAALVKHKHAPAGKRISVQLFTKHAHEKNGDSVYVRARRPDKKVYANERGKNNGWAVWHVTTKKRDGRRLIRELRREVRQKSRAKFRGTLVPAGAISTCPLRFKIRKYNTVYAGSQMFCAQ